MRKILSWTVALYMVAAVSMPQANAQDVQKSLGSLITAAKKNPNDLTLRREIAKAMIGKGLTVKAAEQIQMIINVAGPNADDLTLLGDALRYSADYAGCIQAYNKALTIAPLNTTALSGLSLAYASSGQTAKAISICRTGLRQTSDARGRQQLAETLNSLRTMDTVAHATTSTTIQQ